MKSLSPTLLVTLPPLQTEPEMKTFRCLYSESQDGRSRKLKLVGRIVDTIYTFIHFIIFIQVKGSYIYMFLNLTCFKRLK